MIHHNLFAETLQGAVRAYVEGGRRACSCGRGARHARPIADLVASAASLLQAAQSVLATNQGQCHDAQATRWPWGVRVRGASLMESGRLPNAARKHCQYRSKLGRFVGLAPGGRCRTRMSAGIRAWSAMGFGRATVRSSKAALRSPGRWPDRLTIGRDRHARCRLVRARRPRALRPLHRCVSQVRGGRRAAARPAGRQSHQCVPGSSNVFVRDAPGSPPVCVNVEQVLRQRRSRPWRQAGQLPRQGLDECQSFLIPPCCFSEDYCLEP